MARKPELLNSHLGLTDGPLAKVMVRLAQQKADLKLVQSLLPPELRGHCVHADLRTGEGLIYMDSPVWANRAHYYSADILACLRQQVPASIRRLRIQVIPRVSPTPPAQSRRTAALSEQAVRVIQSAATAITDSALSAALIRLSRRGLKT